MFSVYNPMAVALPDFCSKIAVQLKHKNKINFIAFDFDLTMVDVHTGGVWKGSDAQLASHIRSFFKAFIPAASKNGMHLAVVSFSKQAKTIRNVLREAFGEKTASNIVVRGTDGSWHYRGRGCMDGKMAHIASAAEELSMMNCLSEHTFTRDSTLLFDDDVRNVELALDHGVRAVWCNPNDQTTMVMDLLSMC